MVRFISYTYIPFLRKEIPDFLAFRRITKLSESRCLNLPNALPGHVEPFPHFLQGQGMPGLQAETQNDDLTLPWIQP